MKPTNHLAGAVASIAALATVAVAVWLLLAPAPALDAGTDAGTGAGMDGGIVGPDVIVGDLHDFTTWGRVGDVVAYSVGTTSCNKGDQELLWEAGNSDHPVIGQNLYRLLDGRLEQIGQSWLKHGFFAVAQDGCGFGCQNPGTGDRLGVGCSDPYSASLNGDQGGFGIGGLGPRFEVNATTGVFPYPYSDQGATGDAVYKRLQVPVTDLDPTLNGGARYFVEGHYIANDDAAAGNGGNNASYREVEIGAPPSYAMSAMAGASTEREKAAIFAWSDNDPAVTVEIVDVPGDGRFHVASRAEDNGDGTWRYDYAVHNLSSHRAARAFVVPIPAAVTPSGLGFRDVDYHSGEPFSGTDWSPLLAAGALSWSTDIFAVDPDANALRWGTTYSFRFDADRPPGTALATLGLFRDGEPSAVAVTVRAPSGASIFSDGFESGDTSSWSLTAVR